MVKLFSTSRGYAVMVTYHDKAQRSDVKLSYDEFDSYEDALKHYNFCWEALKGME